MTAKFNDSVRKGDTYQHEPVYRVAATKEPIDITGSTVSGGITKGGVTTPFTCSLVAPTQGKFRFGLSAGTTSTLEVGQYTMELKITLSDNTVKTFFTGTFAVTA